MAGLSAMAVCMQKRQRCRRCSGSPRLVLKAWKLPGESHIGMGMAEPESQPHTVPVAEISTQVKADSLLCSRNEFQVEPGGNRAGTARWGWVRKGVGQPGVREL